MRSIYKIVVCSLLTLSITSCEKDLLEKEQYQKEIYLIPIFLTSPVSDYTVAIPTS